MKRVGRVVGFLLDVIGLAVMGVLVISFWTTMWVLFCANAEAYTASSGEWMARQDVYAERVVPEAGVYEFTFQVSVNDQTGLFSGPDTRLQCWLDVDAERRIYLGATNVGEWSNAYAAQNGWNNGNLSGVVRARVEEFVLLDCRYGADFGAAVNTVRLYVRRVR
jgi:hypothetical protein